MEIYSDEILHKFCSDNGILYPEDVAAPSSFMDSFFPPAEPVTTPAAEEAPILAPVKKRTAVLDQTDGPLGLEFVAAPDGSGVMIAGISDDGIAAEAGTIQLNDYVWSVNGHNMAGASVETVTGAIAAQDFLTLVICEVSPEQQQQRRMSMAAQRKKSEPQAPAVTEETRAAAFPASPAAAGLPRVRTVTVYRDDAGFGIRIITKPGLRGFHIATVSPEGAAASTGQVFPDDVILKVGVNYSIHRRVN